MKRLLLMDEKNYDPDLPEITRDAVRGIVWHKGKMLFIKSSFGEVKLPGGGVEKGESDIAALIREVREETGFEVIPDSVMPFGYVEEKRLSRHEPMIWHQFSRLYFCEVADVRGKTEFTENEKRAGMHCVTMTLEEAIENNRRMLNREGVQPYNRREFNTLQLIKKHMND